MEISEKDYEKIPKEDLSHIYRWSILTSIKVDKQFLDKYLEIKYFLGYFYLKFTYNDSLIYHRFENLRTLSQYIKLKWSIVFQRLDSLQEIFMENGVHPSVDNHWALKESFSRCNKDFVSLLSHPTRVDKNSVDQETKKILEWKTS